MPTDYQFEPIHRMRATDASLSRGKPNQNNIKLYLELTSSFIWQCVMKNQDGNWADICRDQSQAVTQCANET